MEIRIANNKVEIEGYVNAVERKSKPLMSRMGAFIERICKGAFKRALQRNDDIRILLNHNWSKDLGGTKEGNLELTEDNIGLRARAIISDPEVVQKAREGGLVGWSFGFTDVDVDEHLEEGVRTRDVKDLDLYEVSLLDRSKIPAYEGTLVNVRSEDGTEKSIYYSEEFLDDINVRDDKPEPKKDEPKQPEADKVIDYSKIENIIKEMKGAN